MSKSTESPLLSAARSLSEGLQRFEELSEELCRMVINSDKSLQRARRGLQECAEQELKLAEDLRAFAGAMQGMQAAQQRCMEQTAAATARVQERQLQRLQLQQRLQALGESARDVSAPVVELSEADSASTNMLSSLQEVARRLEAVINEAAEVTSLAHADDWADLERDTRSLEQQLQATRNRVVLSLGRLAKDAPS